MRPVYRNDEILVGADVGVDIMQSASRAIPTARISMHVQIGFPKLYYGIYHTIYYIPIYIHRNKNIDGYNIKGIKGAILIYLFM